MREVTLLIKVCFILLVAIIVGYNRGKNNKFAGVKTHVFVGLGAFLSFEIPLEYTTNHVINNFDPFRMSAQVISGIGFLGAGTIIKGGNSVRGLTTAASLWLVAIVAIAIAAGSYLLALISFLIMTLILNRHIIRLISTSRYSTTNLLIQLETGTCNVKSINDLIDKYEISYQEYKVLEQNNKEAKARTKIMVVVHYNQTKMGTNELISAIGSLDYVIYVRELIE